MWPSLNELQWQIDVAAAIMAVFALLISIWFGWRQWHLQWETLRLQRDSDIIAWSYVALDACCTAEMLLDPKYAASSDQRVFERERFQTLKALSSSIDKGRLYFPNVEEHRYGLHKQTAFRGLRHAALDELVDVFRLLDGITYDSPDADARIESRRKATTHKREFISIVQSEVDPRRRVHFLKSHQAKKSSESTRYT